MMNICIEEHHFFTQILLFCCQGLTLGRGLNGVYNKEKNVMPPTMIGFLWINEGR